MQAKMQQNQVSSKGKKFENGNAKEVAFALENYDNEESSEINSKCKHYSFALPVLLL